MFYPSWDDANQTLWVFSGRAAALPDAEAALASGVAENDNTQDIVLMDKDNGDIDNANKPSPSNPNFQPSSLFAKSNNPIDMDSIRKRIPRWQQDQHSFCPQRY